MRGFYGYPEHSVAEKALPVSDGEDGHRVLGRVGAVTPAQKRRVLLHQAGYAGGNLLEQLVEGLVEILQLLNLQVAPENAAKRSIDHLEPPVQELTYRRGDRRARTYRRRDVLFCQLCLGRVLVSAGGCGRLFEVQEPSYRRGGRRHREPGDVQQLRPVVRSPPPLGPHTRLDPAHRRHHVAGYTVLDGAEELAHQQEGVETILGEHLVVAGRVGDDPLSVNPVVLWYRRQVTYYLPFFGSQDPTMHLVPGQGLAL